MSVDRARPGSGDLAEATDIRGYWKRFAEAFVAPLAANGLLENFIANTAVTGAYAESLIKSLIRNLLPPLRLSTGAIIRTTDLVKGADLRTLPQVDLIVWDPTELPPLFEQGDFALVHTQAARAIIEVKRSVSSVPRFRQQLDAQRMRLLTTYRRNVLGVVVTHRDQLFTKDVGPEWVGESELNDPSAMTRLLSRKPAGPDPDGIFVLIYFLSYVARLGRNAAQQGLAAAGRSRRAET